MTGWRFEAARFVSEVLKPVQDGWRPDEDLFRAYLLPLDTTDKAVITAAVEEVGKQFTKQQYRNFRRATEILRAQHKVASETLLAPERREAHRAQVTARQKKLTTVVKHRLGGAPGLPGSEVAAQARTLKAPRSAIVAALRAAGGVEVEPVELPDAPEPGRWNEAKGHLSQLRHDSLWDYLSAFGGPNATTGRLSARRDELRVGRSADTTAETTLLRLVQGWIEKGDLVRVLRHEVLVDLADKAAYGYPEAAAGAKAVADRLRQVGIGVDPAGVAYAVWCERQLAPASTEPGWQEHYQQAVGSLRLRAALTVLREQPVLPEGWAQQRDALEKRLADLDAELERCRGWERTDVEAAAKGYYRIRDELADDRIDAALERCRPAAPAAVTAEAREGRVVLSWKPSTSTVGRIGYRVSRAGAVLGDDISACEFTDDRPPGGVPLAYSVHALRDGNPSARATAAPAVTVLGEVLDLEVRGGADSVSGRWRLPEGAIGALVTRGGVTVGDAHSTSFVDDDVVPGTSYDYQVRARYRFPDGSAGLSNGVHATARCQEVPVAVTDLVVGFDQQELVIRWTPPPRGEVEVLELRQGKDIPEPGLVSLAVARRYGVPVRVAGFSGRGQLRGTVSVPGQRHTLIPITVLGELAAVGQACEVDVRQGAVEALRLDRYGATVRVTWEWPPGATAARVVWRKSAKPSGPADPRGSALDVTRVEYDSRGVSISVPEGDYWFGVCTSLSSDGVASFGPLAFRRESTTSSVRYEITRRALFARGRRTLVVNGDQEVPGVVLLAKSGVRPMNADDGEVLLRLEGGEPPRVEEFEVPAHLRRPVHLRAFSQDARIVLVPTDPEQLVVRRT